jgi:hypothetical protein
MRWPWEHRPALTTAQLAVENLLTQLTKLPVGQSIVLMDRAGDGFGGLVVKRHSRHTLVFQRSGFQGHSRWADRPDEAREEIAAYINTGKLHEPDNIKGF